MLYFEQVLKANRFQWDSAVYLRLNALYSEWRN